MGSGEADDRRPGFIGGREEAGPDRVGVIERDGKALDPCRRGLPARVWRRGDVGAYQESIPEPGINMRNFGPFSPCPNTDRPEIGPQRAFITAALPSCFFNSRLSVQFCWKVLKPSFTQNTQK